jgi:peptidoglycan/LPS O-acetylase OafA/YrhL
MLGRRAAPPASLASPVQTLRGLACLLLVAYHVVGSEPTTGLMAADGTLLRHLAESFLYLRMPLFAFIAGLVYSFRSVEPGRLRPFVLGKVRRLLVPMLVVGTAQFALQAATRTGLPAEGSGGLWRALFFSHSQFWFLQAIFWDFVLVACLDAAGLLARRPAITLAPLAAAALCATGPVQVELLSIGDALYLLPFFLLGLGQGRFGDPLDARGGVAAALVAAIVGLAATQAGLLGLLSGGPVGRTAPIALALGAAACLLLIRSGWRNSPLERVGAYSYSIFLFHMFGIAALRMVLQRAGVHSPHLLFAALLPAGVFPPMIVQALASRHRLSSMLLLGQRGPRRAAGAVGPGAGGATGVEVAT